MRQLYFFLSVLVVVIAFASCNDNNDLEKLRQDELRLLDDFVNRYEAAHNVTLSQGTSGLYYIEVARGTGDTIVAGDVVQVWYNTYLLKDTILIDSNIEGGRYNPLEFRVTTPNGSSVIEGLNEAVKNMQPNGKAFLIVPSELAYGQTGSTSVPAFSTLLFDIEIYKVYRAADGY
jgi:FKBP-type peptidyl-prolyl cis-trans isomerase